MFAVDELQVVIDDVRDRRGLHDAQAGHVTRQAVAEELLGRRRAAEERIVVEKHEMLGQPFDPVDVELDCVGVERRQVFRGDEIRMVDDMQFGVQHPQPCGQVSPGDEVDFTHPRGEPFDAPEPVMQIPPVAVADFGGVFVFRAPGLPEVALPVGIVSVHPEYHKVDRCHVVCR